jgi:hypothetical protein
MPIVYINTYCQATNGYNIVALVRMMGFEPTLCLRWYIKRASLLGYHSFFGASANLTPGFLLQDIFHHVIRFNALCPSSELHPHKN